MTSITDMLTRRNPPIRRGELSTGLSVAEMQQLTIWKRTYTLETQGFTADEARGIAFYAWLRERGRV
jgi:hypothetical protein